MGAGFPGWHPGYGGGAKQAGRCSSLLQVDQTPLVGGRSALARQPWWAEAHPTGLSSAVEWM